MRHLRHERQPSHQRDGYVQNHAPDAREGTRADRREPKTQRNNSILTTMRQPKYTCANCESEKEPYFSRSEPMGFYCADCGRNFDALDLQDAKATADFWIQKAKEAEQAAADLKAEVEDWKKEYTTERALADRLGKMLELYYVNDDITHHAGIANALAAWKEARSE
jgi:DNA-directed RNA polymerase subunit RPC12/RpoP